MGAGLTACGGSNTSLAVPPATPAPTATPTTTPTSATGTTTVTSTGPVTLPAPAGYSASLGIPAGTVLPAGESIGSTVSTTQPSSLTTAFSIGRAAASIRNTRLAGATPLGFLAITQTNTSGSNVTVIAGTSVSFGVPSSISIPSGSSVYGAVLDTSNTSGWVYNPAQITCTFASSTATCTTSASFTLVAGRTYGVAFYYQATIPTGIGSTSITGTGTVALPAPSGYTASVVIPAGTKVPSGETLSTTVSPSQPTTIPTFTLAGTTPIGYFAISSNTATTILSGTALTFGAPSITVPSGSSLYAAVVDPTNSFGYAFNPSAITCSVASNVATCTTSSSFSLAANVAYGVVFYVGPTVATASSTPVAASVSVPTPAPGASTLSLTIPAPAGITSAVTVPTTASIPAGTTVSSTVTAGGVPSGYPAFSVDRAPASTRESQLAGATVLAAFGLSFNNPVSLNGSISISASFAPGVVQTGPGISVQGATSDGVNWYYNTVPCTSSVNASTGFTTVTCTFSGAYTLQANTKYGFAIYVGTTPTTAAPSPVPAISFSATTASSTNVTSPGVGATTYSLGKGTTATGGSVTATFSGTSSGSPGPTGLTPFSGGTVIQYVSFTTPTSVAVTGPTTVTYPSAAIPATATPNVAAYIGGTWYPLSSTFTETSTTLTIQVVNNGSSTTAGTTGSGPFTFAANTVYGFALYY